MAYPNYNAFFCRIMSESSMITLGIVGTIALSSQAAAKDRRHSSGSLMSVASVSLVENAAAGDEARAADVTATEAAESIVVTGTRIIRDGYEAPTPVSVIGGAEIERAAKVNIAEMLWQLPALAGMTKTNTTTVSAGQVGIQSPNLRNLGIVRTLVLLDGQRIPPATTGMLTDLNTIPNTLVKRVDIVTGGASAQWGSDAVGGVINFVLDKEYSGFKAEASGGISTYGDSANFKIALTGGLKFAGDRGRFLVSAENIYDDGSPPLTSRSWYKGSKSFINPAFAVGNGQPFTIFRDSVGYTNIAPGFIISSAGPLRGTLFGPGGQVSTVRFESGSGDPTRQWAVGGDWKATDFGNGPQQLMPSNSRQNVFTRLSYDVSNHVNVYAQFMSGRSSSHVISTPSFTFGTINPASGNIAISVDNPFLPASVRQAMIANNLTTVRGGSYLDALGGSIYDSERQQFRYTLGATGDFNLLGRDWNFNAYWNRNIAFIFQQYMTFRTANLFRAIDAVTGPNGTPICRSTLTDPSNGCSPFNILGTGVASPASIEYITGKPTLNQRLLQQQFAASFNGNPLDTWAGPVLVAFGAEHRSEAGRGTQDTPSLSNSYWAGNYKAINGSYNVTEGFLETAVPLLKDSSLGKSLDVSAAVRVARYTSSGTVTSWKLGVSYSPVDDLRLRITRSRDMRAGNLSELFQPGQSLTLTINNPFAGNANQTYIATTVGNPSVLPEKADTLTIGAVVRPRWLPGLSLSADYWSIRFKDQIASVSAATLLTGCFDSTNPEYCQFVSLNADRSISQIFLRPINIGRVWASGVDIEASYRFSLSGGQAVLRALATRYLATGSNSELPGAIDSFNNVGVNGALPYWRALFQATYAKGPFTVDLTGRFVSAGRMVGPSAIECTTSCPLYDPTKPNNITNNNRITINDDHVNAFMYLDLSLNYKFLDEKFESFVIVNNIANLDPPRWNTGTGIGSQQTGYNSSFYDILGRTFRAGVRFKY